MPDDTRPDAKNARAPLFRALKAIAESDRKVTSVADDVDTERALNEAIEKAELTRRAAKDQTSQES